MVKPIGKEVKMKKIVSTLAATMVAATSLGLFSIPVSHAAYEDYTEDEIAKIEADLKKYQAEIEAYGEKYGHSTNRFAYPNGKYYPVFSERET